MRALIQRVKSSSVTIEGTQIANIGKGLLVLIGIENEDNEEDIQWLCAKITHLRIFPDENQVMNKSIIDTDGDMIIVSQFTLQASTKKGNRPSYIKAAKPEISIPLYEQCVQQMESELGKKVETGKFGADMDVKLVNWGPVTIFIDTKAKN